MKNMKVVFKSLVLPTIFAWFFLTIFVDIFTVPTIFRTLENPPLAGQVGMKVFSFMNSFEILFGVITLIGSFCFYKTNKSIKWFFFSFPLMIWSLFYKFFMTPKIANAAIEMHQVEVTDPVYTVLQNSHAHYHALYRYFDISKLLFLLIFMTIILITLVKESKQERL